MIEELSSILSSCDERLYKWLHTLAGLILDYPQSLTEAQPSAEKLGKKPNFTLGANYMGYLVSTKSIVQRIFQRVLSQQILALQIEALAEQRSFMTDVSNYLYTKVDEFVRVKAGAVRFKSFAKVSDRKYLL